LILRFHWIEITAGRRITFSSYSTGL
jgi:hypothetical protein